MEINNDYYESLLDDPKDIQEEQVEDLDDDSADEEPLLPEQPSDNNGESENEENGSEQNNDSDDDIITSYLKLNGIADPTKIQFENDEGGIDEVDFNSLSREEQLSMLRELGTSGYTDYEKDVINYYVYILP